MSPEDPSAGEGAGKINKQGPGAWGPGPGQRRLLQPTGPSPGIKAGDAGLQPLSRQTVQLPPLLEVTPPPFFFLSFFLFLRPGYQKVCPKGENPLILKGSQTQGNLQTYVST